MLLAISSDESLAVSCMMYMYCEFMNIRPTVRGLFPAEFSGFVSSNDKPG
jgi:hypothetical protein